MILRQKKKRKKRKYQTLKKSVPHVKHDDIKCYCVFRKQWEF